MSNGRRSLERISELADEGYDLYYRWVSQLFVVSVGGVTLLISMQSNFVPADPIALWLLQFCWLLFAGAILAGALTLHGRHHIVLQVLKFRMRQHQVECGLDEPAEPESTTSNHAVGRTTIWHRTAGAAFPLCLAAALVTLCLFALLNLGRSDPKSKSQNHQEVQQRVAKRHSDHSSECLQNSQVGFVDRLADEVVGSAEICLRHHLRWLEDERTVFAGDGEQAEFVGPIEAFERLWLSDFAVEFCNLLDHSFGGTSIDAEFNLRCIHLRLALDWGFRWDQNRDDFCRVGNRHFAAIACLESDHRESRLGLRSVSRNQTIRIDRNFTITTRDKWEACGRMTA